MSQRRAAVSCALGLVLVVALAPVATAMPAKRKPKPVPAACTLVSETEASAFLGVAVTKADSGSTACDYTGDGSIAAVTIRIMQLKSKGNVAFTKRQIKATPGATFPKLGDVAAETIVQGGGGDIQVLKGNVLLDLSARKSDGASHVVALDPAAFLAFVRTAVTKL